MKLLHLIPSADLTHGGPIEHAVKLGVALAARGHRQDLLTIDPPDSPVLADIPAIVHALGKVRPRSGGGVFGRAMRWVNHAPAVVPWLRRHAGEYDVVIVSGLWNYLTLAARRGLVGGGVPYVVFTHGMLDPWFKRTYPLKSAIKQLLWFASEGPLLRHADRVLFTCDEERLLARQSFSPYRVRERVVAFGTADVEGDPVTQERLFRAAVPGLGDARYLLFLSRIHEKKGVDLLVEAFGAVTQRYPDIELVIAGPDHQGLQAGLQQHAAQAGCADRIHWPGMLRGDAKWGAFRGCEAFVLTSHQENFGIVVAEAMACARPVLISDKVNIWREIEQDGAGLVEPDTPAGAERLLQRFLAMDDIQRESMGKRARASFLSRFLMASAVDDFEHMLEDVLTTRKSEQPSSMHRAGTDQPEPRAAGGALDQP